METSQTYKQIRTIRRVYRLSFLYSFGLAIPAYINSTFIEQFIEPQLAGIVFTIASILSIIGLALIPLFLRRVGNYKASLWSLALTVMSLLGLAFIDNGLVAIVLFITYFTVTYFLAYNIDIFLETYSDDEHTGGIRGALLSINSVAWVISPVIAGFVLGNGVYWRIFLISAVLFTLITPIILRNFKNYQDPHYDRTPFWKTLLAVYKDKDIYKIFSAQILLRLFYSLMVIYSPIYLHQYVGLPWSSIGIIFTVMLVPFVLLEYPLGRIADSTLGEKEIMTVGFLIVACSTASLTFVPHSVPMWVWAAILFMTRVGASMIESMQETYFFKKIDGTKSELLGFFRMISPFGYLIGPIAASVILFLVDFRFLFLVLGIVMLWGIRYSLTLRDTR